MKAGLEIPFVSLRNFLVDLLVLLKEELREPRMTLKQALKRSLIIRNTQKCLLKFLKIQI